MRLHIVLTIVFFSSVGAGCGNSDLLVDLSEPDHIIRFDDDRWNFSENEENNITESTFRSVVAGLVLGASRSNGLGEGIWLNSIHLNDLPGLDTLAGRVLTLKLNLFMENISAPGVYLELVATEFFQGTLSNTVVASTKDSMEILGSSPTTEFALELSDLPDGTSDITVLLGYGDRTVGRVNFSNIRVEVR